MKFLNSIFLNGYISKMAELPDNYIINGQVYDKNTMTPIARQTIPIISTKYNELNLNQIAFNHNICGNSRIDCTMISDIDDINISYKITQNYDNSSTATLYKIINNNGEYSYIEKKMYSGYYDKFDIITQDSNNIYVLLYRNNNVFIITINKQTLGYLESQSLSTTFCASVICENGTYIYLYSVNTSQMEIVSRFNKNTREVVNIYSKKLSNNYIMNPNIAICDSVNNVFYSVHDSPYITGNADNHYYIYTKNILDTVNNQLTTSIVNIDLSEYINENILIGKNPDGNCVINELLIYDDILTNKKYITHFIHLNRDTENLNVENSAMFTFEIIDEDNWKLIDCKLFNPITYKAILPIYENATILALHCYGCDIFSWNNISDKYEKVTSIDESMTSVGIDTNNNIFLQKADTSVELISKTVPSLLFADFEEDTYNFESENIETNIIVYAKNFQNNFLNASIELQLIGNVKFTDDGMKIKKTSTSNLGEIKIPVTITNTGRLQVYIKHV